MPKIILKTGNSQLVSLDAVQGSIGDVSFKCWDVKGSEALRTRILERNASNASYYVLGPVVRGLINKLERGGKHSVRTKRKISMADRGKKGWRKYYGKPNVKQRFSGAGRKRKDRFSASPGS